jgi:hypothetical protein
VELGQVPQNVANGLHHGQREQVLHGGRTVSGRLFSRCSGVQVVSHDTELPLENNNPSDFSEINVEIFVAANYITYILKLIKSQNTYCLFWQTTLHSSSALKYPTSAYNP